jgi:hypothetical protein
MQPREYDTIVMPYEIIQEFRTSLPLDNGLLLDDIKNGVQIEERDLVDMLVNARSLFVVSTLACRELARVEDCLRLWLETKNLIDGLLASWAQVAVGNHPLVSQLLRELRRLVSLCEDRVDLYRVSASDRRHHAATHGDIEVESFSQRNGGREPRGESDHSSPAHVYSIGRL